MKLSTRVRYGLRALIELASLQQDSPVLLDLVAKRQGISRKYLDAIFARLKAAGIVSSSRGAGGGFMMAMDPADVTVLDVYVGLEGPIMLVDCVTQDRHCGMEGVCPTKDVWDEVSKLMADYMKSLTVADLVVRKQQKEEKSSIMFYI